jgi:PGAP1-like protein
MKTEFSSPMRKELPLILVRGFGGVSVDDERKIAYQGFNDGTVYPQKRGENYIYEGFILRFLKSAWKYQDATNVVGYYANNVAQKLSLPKELEGLPPQFFVDDKVVLDPAMARHLLRTTEDPCRTLWVFRYYDLNDRKFDYYGQALVRLIDLIREIANLKISTRPKVNIIAHSMGGLIVRHAIQCAYPDLGRSADDFINKIVTLGTPHQGIAFQFFKNWIDALDASKELEAFNPEKQAAKNNRAGFKQFAEHFPLERLLTVVGTNYRAYDVGMASRLNRLFSVSGEFGPNYNRSDGLVKQTLAQIPGAPRTFVHKCHGGFDSLVTARESFEIATRFFFGNVRARLRLVDATITRGKDLFGKSEFFFGVTIKPRRVDFELFHQSAEAENCYGPFHDTDLRDADVAFPWAGPDRLIWEGYLDTSSILNDESITIKDMVIRMDVYVGERDLFGIGFSDNVIFRAQHYVRMLLRPPHTLYHYPDERFAEVGYQPRAHDEMQKVKGGWRFKLDGPGFKATFGVEIDAVPE